MILDKETLRAHMDRLLWHVEEARLKVSEHHIVQIIAVGKYTETENIETLYSLGQRAFGENQVQQLRERSEALEALPIAWHMIGTLQKNKINNLIDLHPSLMHSLDSLSLANALNKKLEAKNQRMKCLLQINAAREESKSGAMPEEAVDTYQQISETCPAISLQGVMGIGAHTGERKVIQKSFETTHHIYETLQKEGAKICSMGMSGDYELAIACGSNMIRVGSALFT